MLLDLCQTVLSHCPNLVVRQLCFSLFWKHFNCISRWGTCNLSACIFGVCCWSRVTTASGLTVSCEFSAGQLFPGVWLEKHSQFTQLWPGEAPSVCVWWLPLIEGVSGYMEVNNGHKGVSGSSPGSCHNVSEFLKSPLRLFSAVDYLFHFQITRSFHPKMCQYRAGNYFITYLPKAICQWHTSFFIYKCSTFYQLYCWYMLSTQLCSSGCHCVCDIQNSLCLSVLCYSSAQSRQRKQRWKADQSELSVYLGAFCQVQHLVLEKLTWII